MEERKRWYARVFKITMEEALVKVLLEFKLYLGQEDTEVELDPLNVTAELERLGQDPSSNIQPADFGATFEFFKRLKRKMIKMVPMQTTAKCRYSSGTDLKHLATSPRHEVPELKTFWVTNTERLTNVASQQIQMGVFSVEEEEEIRQHEKFSMLHPASFQSDQSATLDCTDFVRQGLSQMRQQTIDSDDDLEFSSSDSEERAEPNTIDGSDNRAGKTQAAYSNQSRVQWSRQSSILQSISGGQTVASEAISRKSNYRKRAMTVLGQESNYSLASTSAPRKIPLGVDSKQYKPDQPEPAKQYLRPKNRFNGVYFNCFAGICGGVLAGTAVFPLPPKQEKVHFMQSVMAPMDHLDGQPDSQYLDNVVLHMMIRLDSWDYPTRLDYLDRNGRAGYEVFDKVKYFILSYFSTYRAIFAKNYYFYQC